VKNNNLQIKYWTQFGKEENDEWDKVTKNSDTSWLYNTSEYLRHANYINSAWNNLTFGLFTSENKLLGGANAYINRPGQPITAGLSGTFFSEYDAEVEKIIFNHIDELAEANACKSSVIRYSMLAPAYLNADAEGDLTAVDNPLPNYGYKLSLSHDWIESQNYKLRIINLKKPIDVLYNELQGNCRTAIRKAKKNNLTVEIGNSERLCDAFSSFKGRDSHGHGTLAMKNFVENVGDAVQVAVTYLHDEPISASVYNCYKGGILYYANAQHTNPSYKSLAPNNYSMWKMIEWGHKNNYKYIDLGNIYEKSYRNKDSKGYNVSRYKESFGKDYVKPIYGFKEYS